MKIQNINSYNINQSFNQNNKTQKLQIKQSYPQINQLSNSFYTPFFGNNEKEISNNTINAILNENSLEERKKEYLKYLSTIDYFPQAAIGLDKKDLLIFLDNCIFFSPLSEDLLKGDYVVSYKNAEKPIIDLKSIAEYNKKHPKTPKNLLTEVFKTPLPTHFLLEMKANNISEVNEPIKLVYPLDEETKFESIIKYSPKKYTLKDIEKFKYIPLNENLLDIFSLKSISKEDKKLLWELSEIPYFNAATEHLLFEDFLMLLNVMSLDKTFFLEVFKGNVYSQDEHTGIKKPIVDLKEIVFRQKNKIFNEKDYFYKKVFLNVLLTKVLNVILKTKKENNKYPAFLFTEDIKEKKINYTFASPEDVSGIINHIKEKNVPINKFILFKNDLNSLEENNNNNNEIINKKQKLILEKRQKYSTPKIINEYLKNPNINMENKKIVFDFAEEIPYFNYLIKNANEETLDILISLKKSYPDVFDKFVNEKIKIINETNNQEKKHIPLVDFEQIVLDNACIKSSIYKNSFVHDVITILGEILSKLNANIKQESITIDFTIKKEDTDCKSLLKHMETYQKDNLKIQIT